MKKFLAILFLTFVSAASVMAVCFPDGKGGGNNGGPSNPKPPVPIITDGPNTGGTSSGGSILIPDRPVLDPGLYTTVPLFLPSQGYSCGSILIKYCYSFETPVFMIVAGPAISGPVNLVFVNETTGATYNKTLYPGTSPCVLPINSFAGTWSVFATISGGTVIYGGFIIMDESSIMIMNI